MHNSACMFYNNLMLFDCWFFLGIEQKYTHPAAFREDQIWWNSRFSTLTFVSVQSFAWLPSILWLKLMEKVAFQQIFQLGEHVKMVSFTTISSQFTISGHFCRNLFWVQSHMRILQDSPRPQCHPWPHLFMQPAQHYLRQRHGWQHLCTHPACTLLQQILQCLLELPDARSMYFQPMIFQ